MKKHIFFWLTVLLIGVLVITVGATDKWDLSGITEVYRNTFDSETSIKEFSEYGGDWTVKNGRLYLQSGTNQHSFMVYTGEEKLTEMEDYILDVDMYNIRSQAGVVIRSDLDKLSPGSNGFAGYFAFISFDGKKGAIGSVNESGNWAGNLEVSDAVTAPGSDLHLRVIVRGNELRYIVSELKSGDILWEHTETHSRWKKGTFGFRMSAMQYNGLINLNVTSFDNLVISAFPEETPNPIGKMDIWKWLGMLDGSFTPEIWELETTLLWIAGLLGADIEVDFEENALQIEVPIRGLTFEKRGPQGRFTR